MYLPLSSAINYVLRCAIMDTLKAVVKAKRVVSLPVKSALLRDELLYQWFLIYCKTMSTSDIKTYLGCGGIWLNIIANKAQNFGCFHRDLPSMWR